MNSETFSSNSSIPSIIKTYDSKKKFTFYSERTEVLQAENIYNISEKESLANLTTENVFWLDITEPTVSDLKTISELFHIHPLTIEDILSEDGREKTERFEKYIYICTRTIEADQIKTHAHDPTKHNKLFVLLFDQNYLITIHCKPIRQFKSVIRRLHPIKNVFKVTSDWFVYALLDDIVNEYIPNIKSIEFQVDDIDEMILYLKRTNQTEMLRKIGLARNHVNQLIRLLKPKIEIINILIKRHTQQIQEHTLLYLRDTQDHLISMIQNLEQNSETLNRSHNNYLAQISIELAEMSNRMNLQVKILTQVTALALPFAIVGGLWGMNVVVPFEIVNGSMATWDQLIPFCFLVLFSVLLSIGFWFMGINLKVLYKCKFLLFTCSDCFKLGDPGHINFSIPEMEKDPALLALPKAYQNYNMGKKFTFYSDKTDVLQSEYLTSLHETQSLQDLMKDNTFWLDICKPSQADLNVIAEVFHVHPLTIEDIIVQDNREKCEVFEKYLFLCVRTCDIGYFTFGKGTSTNFDDTIIGIDEKQSVMPPNSSNGQQEAINLYLLVFGNYIISIHSEPITHVRHVIRRMYPLKNLFHVTSDWIMYALLDDVVDEFIPNMKTMELEVDSIDDLVLVLRQTDQADMLRRIGRARNQVTHMLRLLKPKTEIIKILTKRTADRLQTHTLLYLRDIQDHLVTMIQNLDQSGETLNRAHNNYLAQISIELAEMSNRMNLQVKKLTEITSLALPFAIIGSLWGMNVIVPMETRSQSWTDLTPFFSLVFVSVILAMAFWVVGRKLKFF